MSTASATHWLTTLSLLLWVGACLVGVPLWLLGRSSFEANLWATGMLPWISGGLMALGLLLAATAAVGPARSMRHRWTAVALHALGLALVGFAVWGA